MDIGQFSSMSIHASQEPFTLDVSPSMEHIGDSLSHRFYWNKVSSSVGLLCGSSQPAIDSVTRRFAMAHQTKEHDTDESPRILVLRTAHHNISPPHGSIVATAQVFGSPRSVSISPQRRPLRLREQDISARHVLALFMPPMDMHNATASKIKASIQYVVSRLQTPFDLQDFIQLMEQESWDDASINFITLRQTILTELLAPYDAVEARAAARLPLHDLKEAVIDLTDPVLCSTRLDSVLMDMALYAFLNGQAGKGRTLIVLSAAHEYLYTSSYLMRTLESFISQNMDNISILITTPNLQALTLSPCISSTIEYIVLAGPIRSHMWTEALKSYIFSSETRIIPPFLRGKNEVAVLSPRSQQVESATNGEGASVWGDMFMSFVINEVVPIVPTELVTETNEQPGYSGDLSKTSLKSTSGMDNREETSPEAGITYLDASEDLYPIPSSSRSLQAEFHHGARSDLAASLLKANPGPNLESVSAETPYSGVPYPPSAERQSKQIPEGASDSDDSSEGEEPGNLRSAIVNWNDMAITNGKGKPKAHPLFDLSTHLPPSAYIKAHVNANMYPETFKCLVSTILTLSGGFSNVVVPINPIKAPVSQVIKTMKARGTPVGHKNFNKMLRRAWEANIVRFLPEDQKSVFLVNLPTAGLSRMAPSGAITETASQSPFLSIVDTIARNGGPVANNYIPLHLVRQEVGNAGVVQALGFYNFSQYLKEAERMRLVVTDKVHKGPGGKVIALRWNWTELRPRLLRHGHSEGSG
ncbi:hypothetical protein M408DRAFT_334166 [Serendipita vermifera MAFF 305830]|uniref:Uncharacterized protein n=1 Tax=Serendipita vermifera MAFF 305830 TaxID=933852 RepID=A0A0C2W0K5_SERVB|nr:hypothetical protein M408DRAFT_334166 [Serendipita vermifera MAFF 305830]